MSRLRFGRARTGHCQVLELAYPELGLIAECPGTTCWPPLDVSKNSTLDFISTICKLRGFLDLAVLAVPLTSEASSLRAGSGAAVP